MQNSLICQVCNKEAHKYKCPACFAKYCGLSCFKGHREPVLEEGVETSQC